MKARTVLQYSHCAHDTARAWALGAGQQAGRWACWRWARRQGLRGVRAGRAGRAAGGHAWGARAWHAGERHDMGKRSANGRASARAAVTLGGAQSAHGGRYCSCDTAMLAYDTAGPGCDTAGPRATIRPLCAPGRACARLGVLSWARFGFLCTLTRFWPGLTY